MILYHMQGFSGCSAASPLLQEVTLRRTAVSESQYFSKPQHCNLLILPCSGRDGTVQSRRRPSHGRLDGPLSFPRHMCSGNCKCCGGVLRSQGLAEGAAAEQASWHTGVLRGLGLEQRHRVLHRVICPAEPESIEAVLQCQFHADAMQCNAALLSPLVLLDALRHHQMQARPS